MSLRTKSLLAVMLGNTIFGFSFLFSKTALQMTSPSVMLAVRFTTAFVVLNLVVLLGRMIRKKDGQPLLEFSLKGKPIRYALMLAVIQPVIYFIAESYAITYTSSAFAGTIIAVVPVAGILLDVLLMHTKVTRRQVICAAGSVIGVAVTTVSAQEMKSSAIGMLFLLITLASGSLFFVFSKKAGEYFNSLERTYVMFGTGCAVYVVIGLVQSAGKMEELVLPAVTNPAFWGCILYLAVASSVVAYLLLNYGSFNVTISEASIFANFTTVISIVAGVVILHEKFTLQQGIGAALILVSVYFASVGGNAHKERKKNG